MPLFFSFHSRISYFNKKNIYFKKSCVRQISLNENVIFPLVCQLSSLAAYWNYPETLKLLTPGSHPKRLLFSWVGVWPGHKDSTKFPV